MPRIIAAAGGALIIYQWASARPLWLDEEMIALNIRERGLGALAGPLSFEQNAPYGWLALQRLAYLAFGQSELALRAVPLLFGLGAIATALWIGRRWLTPAATSVLVLLCSVGQWISYSSVELKHYSADACLALLLLSLAAWALESDRLTVWWIVAATAQWFGNGALFVTPACALVLVAVTLRRRGWPAARRAAAPGVLWLAAFAPNYLVTLRHAHASAYLQSYWAFAFPPASAGMIGALDWIAERLVPFAEKPGGASLGVLGVLLWAAAVAGFALATGRRRPLALMCATVPLSAFALAVAHVLPFFERLVLWVVPALYAGVALVADRVARAGRLAAAAGALIVVPICADLTWNGLDDLKARPRSANHRLDDRAAVRWLAAQRRPGDAWMTTHLALPALWWYADTAVDAALEAKYAAPDADCRPAALRDAVQNYRRVIVYFGFRFDDVPKGFDDLLLDRFGEIGSLVAYRPFADASRAAIVDLTEPSHRDPNRPIRPDATPEELRLKPHGCIEVRPARRW